MAKNGKKRRKLLGERPLYNTEHVKSFYTTSRQIFKWLYIIII